MALERQVQLSDYLAIERTSLAWIRTGLALMGFGFVVARFGLFLQQLQVAEQHVIPTYGQSLWFGTALIGVGVLVNVYSAWHHMVLVGRLQRGESASAHPWYQAVVVAIVLVCVGTAMAIYLISIRPS